MSQKSNFSLSSINFAVDFLFRVVLPPHEPKDVSKKKLKSPAKTICLSHKSSVVSNIFPRSWRVATCSVLVLELSILTRTKVDPSTLTSNIKIRSFLLIFLSKTSTLLLPIYPIATPQKFVLPCEKSIDPFNSSAHYFSGAKDEWLSCKNKNSLEPKLIFQYSDILILLREFCSLLTLFDIKCNFSPITY